MWIFILILMLGFGVLAIIGFLISQEQVMNEDIVNPQRYTHTKLECWDFWLEAMLNPLICSAVKYVWRYKYKNGLADLEKTIEFLEKAENSMLEVYYTEREYYLRWFFSFKGRITKTNLIDRWSL